MTRPEQVIEPDYPAFDPEVVELCRAMNALPGITTSESCCGHGKEGFIIFFRVAEADHRGLFILTWSVDNGYFKHGPFWEIKLNVSDSPTSPLPINFMLESTVRGEEAYKQAQDVVDNIVYHRKHEAFMFGFGLQEYFLREE